MSNPPGYIYVASRGHAFQYERITASRQSNRNCGDGRPQCGGMLLVLRHQAHPDAEASLPVRTKDAAVYPIPFKPDDSKADWQVWAGKTRTRCISIPHVFLSSPQPWQPETLIEEQPAVRIAACCVQALQPRTCYALFAVYMLPSQAQYTSCTRSLPADRSLLRAGRIAKGTGKDTCKT